MATSVMSVTGSAVAGLHGGIYSSIQSGSRMDRAGFVCPRNLRLSASGRKCRLSASMRKSEIECHTQEENEQTNFRESFVNQASEVMGSSTLKVASISAFAALQSLAVAPPASALEFLIFTEDEIWTAIAFVVVFGGYLLAVPPVIYTYLEKRWFVRSMPETYFQFLLVFLFFPAMLLWAPFINLRRFGPKDQS